VGPPPPLEIPVAELAAIVERTKAGALSGDDHAKLKAAVGTLAFLTAELQAKGTSLDRLRRLLFGAPTEKTRTILGTGAAPDPPDAPPPAPADPVETLRAQHEERGLRLHARTACPGWLGERLDLTWAIDVLHPLANRSSPCAQSEQPANISSSVECDRRSAAP